MAAGPGMFGASSIRFVFSRHDAPRTSTSGPQVNRFSSSDKADPLAVIGTLMKQGSACAANQESRCTMQRQDTRDVVTEV